METTGFLGSISDWLSKPENQLLLANAGAKLDPQGVGGALGGATGAYLQSNIAAERAKKQEEAQNDQRKMLTDVLTRMADPNGNILTPKGQPGPTGVSANNDGSIKITADLSPNNQVQPTNAITPPRGTPQQIQTGNTSTPAVSPAGAALIQPGTSSNPITLPGTTVVAAREPTATTASTPATDPYSRNMRPFDIRSVIPFS